MSGSCSFNPLYFHQNKSKVRSNFPCFLFFIRITILHLCWKILNQRLEKGRCIYLNRSYITMCQNYVSHELNTPKSLKVRNEKNELILKKLTSHLSNPTFHLYIERSTCYLESKINDYR
jgi:hypothetical protein